MKQGKDKTEKIKFFASVPMMLGMIFTIFVAYGLFLFVTIHTPARLQLTEKPLYYVFVCIITVVLSTIIFIQQAPRWFTLFEIDEKGLKSSLFHFLMRKEIKWNEIQEIRYYERLSPFIFISTNGSLEGLTYNSIIKRKGLFQISLTPKVYKAIKEYTDKEIAGLSEERIRFLKLDK